MNRTPYRRRHQHDAFRTLAIAGIVLGLLLVIGAAVFWAVTGRQSTLIVGAGMTLAIGGGLRNMLAGLVDQIPGYERHEPLDPPVFFEAPPPPPVTEDEGGE